MANSLEPTMAARAVDIVVKQDAPAALALLAELIVSAAGAAPAPSPAKPAAGPKAPSPQKPPPSPAKASVITRAITTKLGVVTLDEMEVEECQLAGADLVAFAEHKLRQAQRGTGAVVSSIMKGSR